MGALALRCAGGTAAIDSVDLGADAPLGALAQQYGNAVGSPDGTTLVFVGQLHPDAAPQLSVAVSIRQRRGRCLGRREPTPPFFSNDGTSIGFDGSRGLTKVAITRGAQSSSAGRVTSRRGMEDDGSIVFTQTQRPGGHLVPRAVQRRDAGAVDVGRRGRGHSRLAERAARRACLLVGTGAEVTAAFNDANLVVQPLPAGAPTVVQRGGYHPVYVRSGHIVYVDDGALLALPFDAKRLAATGPSFRVVEGLGSNGITGGAQFSVSDAGTLVYLSGPSVGTGAPLDLVDREGLATELRNTRANWFTPAFAPDGRHLALSIREGPSQSGDIWVHEQGRETLAHHLGSCT